jgi:adenylosuccinate lyase
MSMHEEPTAYRVPDPGVRALFTEDSRYQAWLDVEAALAQAEALGGTRRMGPTRAPGVDLVVAKFTDPEGNLVGLAGLG